MEIGSHLLNRLSNTSWAICEDKLQIFANVLQLKYNDKMNMNDLKAEILTQTKSENTLALKREVGINGYELYEDKAIIPIQGTLMKNVGWLDALSGMTSMGDIENSFRNALDDSSVRQIILDIDSPGGTVSGTQQLGELIYESRKEKEIISVVNDSSYSGAYWLASAADIIIATSQTSGIGSIGVYLMHVDYSDALNKEGIKVTFIKAGKYKTMGNEYEPIKGDAKKRLQELVNQEYKMFVDTVARNRNLMVEDAEKWAEGNLFHAEEAKKLGLIDDIMSFDDILAKI